MKSLLLLSASLVLLASCSRKIQAVGSGNMGGGSTTVVTAQKEDTRPFSIAENTVTEISKATNPAKPGKLRQRIRAIRKIAREIQPEASGKSLAQGSVLHRLREQAASIRTKGDGQVGWIVLGLLIMYGIIVLIGLVEESNGKKVRWGWMLAMPVILALCIGICAAGDHY